MSGSAMAGRGATVVRRKRNRAFNELVCTALAHDSLAGFSEVLQCLARSCKAYGCILWQVAPGSDLKADPPKGYLFVLAQWFKDSQACCIHDLPLSSAEGNAVVTGAPVVVEDAINDARVWHGHAFLKRSGITSFCSTPLILLDETKALLNLYRKSPPAFSLADVVRETESIELLPILYRAKTDRVAFDLLWGVNHLLRQAELAHSRSPELTDRTSTSGALQQVCKLVSKTFGCIETSIFLEDPVVHPGKFALKATTWPEELQKDVYEREASSLTGYVLQTQRSVNIFDLAHFARDKEFIKGRYPGVSWQDSLSIAKSVRRILRLNSEDELPPLSYVAAPITNGPTTLGVIRCAAAVKGGLHYFSDRERLILELIASDLSRYWNSVATRRELEQTKAKYDESRRRQTQTFEDLEHQLINPIIQAHSRTQLLLQEVSLPEDARVECLAIRGLCGKVERAAMSVGLFATLAREDQIRLRPSDLSILEPRKLVKMLIEAAVDNELLVKLHNPRQGIKFDVIRESFDVLQNVKVEVDANLLTQMVGNLLDNAGKYSYPHTRVKIYGGLTGTGRFRISVANSGMKIRPDETEKAKTRGYRGESAQLTTSEGTGIGLWIVENIMRAHGGTLIVAPTKNEETVISLVFPASKV